MNGYRIGTLARAISATLARFDEELPMWMSTLPADITARKPDERLAALLVAAGEMPPVLASGPGGPVPFGLLDRATLPFQSMLESVQRTLLHHAWVETLVGGRPVARTIVGWSGDLSTRWCEDRDDATVALHLRSLDVAMGSRDTVLKVFTLITQAALKIAALMAMPGGAILALPVAWRLVERIMRQLEPR